MKINIPNVTLIACTSVHIDETVLSLRKSYQDINFGAVKLLSDTIPYYLPEEISYEHIPKMNNIDDYNLYAFKYLGQHINTSHCLLVQHDSCVLHPELWDNAWLQYDYCGALWPIVPNTYIANNGEIARNGNGGFSLRSKKLLDLPLKMDWNLREEQGWRNEDGQISCYYKREMLENGIKYAPIEVAAVFSYENDAPENINIKEFFGYHKNLPRR